MTQGTSTLDTPHGVRILGPLRPGFEEILTHDALRFLADLHRSFDGRRRTLLRMRIDSQATFDAGTLPQFPRNTADVRESDWTVAPIPADIADRRVEITGPVDRKMIINALNSGAKVFMADFEDSSAPTWDNMIDGQINLRDAVARTITFEHPTKGTYRLADRTAVLFVRPRGLHLPEKHIEIDGEVASGSLVDFGLYFFHNARKALQMGTGPYFYLPKLEHYLEARWWNDVFVAAQEALGVDKGTIKATVLIETLPASFQLDEILWELKDHSAGLNCGRWDYIFSYIKTLRAWPDHLVPDRAQVGMTQPMMAAYTHRVIKVCHRRGIHAMGGMAAQIPIKGDPEANEAALAKVRRDKEREVTDGHDGTWVAHPDLVPLAMDAFDAVMTGPNQIDRQRDDVVTEAELVATPDGAITVEGMRINIRVGVQYLEAWLGGNGCVPLYWLMEDAATAEISRTQLWQWIHHGATLADGRTATVDLYRELVDDEMTALRAQLGDDRFDGGRFALAIDLFDQLITAAECPSFLTLAAYDHITTLVTEAQE
ncbi:MAG: malate synthase A [Alphaproteobacteria bacterium]|nr:malate synthase A [Alphaproteobacteria bacterium]